MSNRGIKKCGGTRHGVERADVYVARNRQATTNEARYQIFDITTRTQHFCPNPVVARELVATLRSAGHKLRKNPTIMDRPYGATTFTVGNGSTKKADVGDAVVAKKQKHSPAVQQALAQLFSATGLPDKLQVEVSINFKVNGKPFTFK